MSGRQPTRIPPAFLAELRDRVSLVELIGGDIPLRRKGREHAGNCPFHAEKSASFMVNEGKGFGHCFGCGAHVDALGWLQRHRGLGFLDAVRELAARAGMAMPGESRPASAGAATARPRPPVARLSAEAIRAEKQEGLKKALRRYWRPGGPWPGTVVDRYLSGARGIPTRRLPDILPVLRHVPAAPYWHGVEEGGRTRFVDLGPWPAMAAMMLTPDKRLAALHVTFLRPDGSGKAEPVCPATGELLPPKKMFGNAWGAAIWVTEPGAELYLAEGIETGLSVLAACPDIRLWVAGSLGNIAGSPDPDRPGGPHPTRPGKRLPSVHPDPARPGLLPPPGVERVTILADADGDQPTGSALVECASRRLLSRGVAVRVARPPAGQDFNDMLRGCPRGRPGEGA